MLTITKNTSKISQAVVKFTKKARPMSMPLSSTIARGVQNQLTEATFRTYLVGFVEITPRDLHTTIGKRIRYAIDTVIGPTRRVVSTKYRLGGIVKAISGDNVILFNPLARKTWTLKITQPQNKRLRLYALVNKIK